MTEPNNHNSNTTDSNSISTLNIIVIVLSIYVLVALILDTFFKLPTEVSRVLNLTDNFICIFFLIEFFIRFYYSIVTR